MAQGTDGFVFEIRPSGVEIKLNMVSLKNEFKNGLIRKS